MLTEYLKDLGIKEGTIADRGLKIYEEVDLNELVVPLHAPDGRPLVLIKEASNALKLMLKKASLESISIIPFSGYRSYLYQVNLIKIQLDKGRKIEEIVTNIAPPGCSEHHTGCAIDVYTENSKPLTEDFENTKAFSWLQDNAKDFGFTLSFPRDNKEGFIYEPWHWCYQIR